MNSLSVCTCMGKWGRGQCPLNAVSASPKCEGQE